MIRVKVNRAVGQNSLGELLRNVDHNMLGKPMQRAVKAAWKSTEALLVADYKALVPKRAEAYPSSHPNRWKYHRKPGRLRSSVGAHHAKRVPSDGLPRAYVRIESWPYRVLLHGTAPRRIKSGKRRGQSTGTGPDRIAEQRFYVRSVPAAMQRATAFLLSSGVVRDPIRRQ